MRTVNQGKALGLETLPCLEPCSTEHSIVLFVHTLQEITVRYTQKTNQRVASEEHGRDYSGEYFFFENFCR